MTDKLQWERSGLMGLFAQGNGCEWRIGLCFVDGVRRYTLYRDFDLVCIVPSSDEAKAAAERDGANLAQENKTRPKPG